MSREDMTLAKAIVKEEYVRLALKADVGPESSLISFNIEDFSDQGATSSIKRIRVDYTKGKEKCQRTYITKMNIGPIGKRAEKKTQLYFKKESVFYNDVVHLMERELLDLNRCLSVPRCFYSVTEPGQELTLMEDISSRGFMRARNNPCVHLDIKHIALVVKEVALFHASALILENNHGLVLEKEFPIIEEKWFEKSNREGFEQWWTPQALIAARIAESKGEQYRKYASWLRSLKGRITDTLIHLAKPSHKKFSVLLHNDIWTDNILFRYNEKGIPCEVALVDLQMITKGSLVIDMIILMFMSMVVDDRRQHWKDLLRSYYGVFICVLEEAGLTVSFSLEELEQEFRRKVPYGVLFVISLGSLFFQAEGERVPKPTSDAEEAQYGEHERKATERILRRQLGSEQLVNLYLNLLEDLDFIGSMTF